MQPMWELVGSRSAQTRSLVKTLAQLHNEFAWGITHSADTPLTISEAVKQRHQVRHRAGEAVLYVRSVASTGYYSASTLPGSPPRSCPPVLRAAQGLQQCGCADAAEEGRARRP